MGRACAYDLARVDGMCLTIHTGDQGPVLRTPIDAQGRSVGAGARSRLGRVRPGAANADQWRMDRAGGRRCLLILLIILIARNLNDAPIHFLGLNGQVSIGLALLLAGVCGLIIAAVPASARIRQLREALKKNARHDLPPPT